MKTKEDIIRDMCITYRHDYGLLPEEERSFVFRRMSQLYDNCIEPHMKMKDHRDAEWGWKCTICNDTYPIEVMFCTKCYTLV